MKQPKWSEGGYKKNMINWAVNVLEESVAFVEVKNTDMSIVLRATSRDGNVYLKTANEAAHFESSLTAFISKEFPEVTVELVAVNEKENWMLTRELSGQSLRENKTVGNYRSLLKRYADFQQQTIPHTEKLLSIGVVNRQLPILKQEIDNHLEALCETGLNEKETVEILVLKQELLDMCDEMTDVLPDALDHGDLHSGNVFVENGTFRLFDWGDASITHPFLSVRVFLNSLFELLEDDTDANWMKQISDFRPVYLEQWKGFAPSDVLERQLYLAEQVGCVYRALSWHLYITPYRRDKKESYNKPAQWLRLLLDHRKMQ